MAEELGERLRKLRERLNLSQGSLGRPFNLAKQTISNYETGKTSPTPEQVRAFADFFGVSTDYLLGRTDDPQPGEIREKAAVQLDGPEDLTPEERRELRIFVDYLRAKRTLGEKGGDDGGSV